MNKLLHKLIEHFKAPAGRRQCFDEDLDREQWDWEVVSATGVEPCRLA